MKRKLKIVVSGILLVMCMGCGEVSKVYMAGIGEDIQTEYTQEVSNVEETEDVSMKTEIYVHVCGAVNSPGVYTLIEGSRVYEAIELAGGFTESAATESINQAEVLKDGQMLRVYTTEEVLLQKESSVDDGKVNINRADEEELMTLPGIGESKAKSILSYREEHGEFSSVEDLKNITGIKEGVYSKIKDYITID